MATLEDTYHVQLSHQSVLNAYLHFEAMSNHDYSYYCVRCGHHPPVLVMDLNKKGAFRLAGTCTCTKWYTYQYTHVLLWPFLLVSDLSVPPCTEKYDKVNAVEFWGQVESEVLARGLTEGMNSTLLSLMQGNNVTL